MTSKWTCPQCRWTDNQVRRYLYYGCNSQNAYHTCDLCGAEIEIERKPTSLSHELVNYALNRIKYIAERARIRKLEDLKELDNLAKKAELEFTYKVCKEEL